MLWRVVEWIHGVLADFYDWRKASDRKRQRGSESEMEIDTKLIVVLIQHVGNNNIISNQIWRQTSQLIDWLDTSLNYREQRHMDVGCVFASHTHTHAKAIFILPQIVTNESAKTIIQ